jgi:lipopolysaccharide/colanic/teichoic acid biosynthesis glycosyltransferase
MKGNRTVYAPIKRGIDILGAAVGLVVLSPLLVLIGATVAVATGLPVFYRQDRAGRHGRVFRLIKFRTMTVSDRGDGESASDEYRLTPVGRFLRRSSLDELPELINVLRGEMSLVGPRPLLTEYVPLYDREQARRHEVRPGITGWAQVNGRNALNWAEKFAFDVWYVDHVGFLLDMRILGATVWQVVRGVGVSAEGHATMPRFTGSPRGEDDRDR